MSCIMSDELKTLSRRISEVENNYSRALALLEDRLNEINVYLSRLNTRIVRLETDELNAIDERLCRLESPSVWEIDRRATAGPSKTSKGSAAPTRVFECRHCPHPCKLYVDVAAVVPDRCPYCNSEADWQELRSPGVSK